MSFMLLDMKKSAVIGTVQVRNGCDEQARFNVIYCLHTESTTNQNECSD